MTNYKFGDVVLIDFPQIELSRRKKRPALVLLDIGDRDIVLAPVTTKERTSRGDYRLRHWKSSGLLRASWVRLAKIACLGKQDIALRLGRLTEHDKKMISELWQRLYDLY